MSDLSIDIPPPTDEPITEAFPLATLRLLIPCRIIDTPFFTAPFQ